MHLGHKISRARVNGRPSCLHFILNGLKTSSEHALLMKFLAGTTRVELVQVHELASLLGYRLVAHVKTDTVLAHDWI